MSGSLVGAGVGLGGEGTLASPAGVESGSPALDMGDASIPSPLNLTSRPYGMMLAPALATSTTSFTLFITRAPCCKSARITFTPSPPV